MILAVYPASGRQVWTAGRIISVVAGAVAVLLSIGLFGAGGTALWAQAQKNADYVDLGTATYSVPGYAVASDTVELHMANGGWDGATALAGTVRLRISQGSGSSAVFADVARAGTAAGYLTGVEYATVRATSGHQGTYTGHSESAPAARRHGPASG